jgi:GrpB-like predicted nucleotidyltransferase (UPF0157 family)
MDSECRDQRTPLSENYLREHTIDELRPLSGPIYVVNYDPEWRQMFERNAQRIRDALGNRAMRIEHAGSTSVPELPAKPVIDIVLVVAESHNEARYVSALETAGYRLHLREPGWYEHRMFKGPEDMVNLHVFSIGCPGIERMVKFRNWLRASKDDRELYARTKRNLAEREWKYTQNYADAKIEVIEEIMSRARKAT